MPPAEAGLVSREPVKNARSLLRNALPINDRYIREIQARCLDGRTAAATQRIVPGSRLSGYCAAATPCCCFFDCSHSSMREGLHERGCGDCRTSWRASARRCASRAASPWAPSNQCALCLCLAGHPLAAWPAPASVALEIGASCVPCIMHILPVASSTCIRVSGLNERL